MKMRLTIKGASIMEAMLAANMVGVRLKAMYSRQSQGSAMGRGGCRKTTFSWIEAETEEMSMAQVVAWQQTRPSGDGALIAWRGML